MEELFAQVNKDVFENDSFDVAKVIYQVKALDEYCSLAQIIESQVGKDFPKAKQLYKLKLLKSS